MTIATISAREILDSRGEPTVEADVVLTNGIRARASVPSGASAGSLEAFELRDNDANRYFGKGVRKAVAHVNDHIAPVLKGMSLSSQSEIDQRLIDLDASPNKSRLGANALLAVSLACAKARAQSIEIPLWASLNLGEAMVLPIPMMNLLNGGCHADNNVDIQEFMIMPVGADSFAMALQMGSEIFHLLKQVLRKKGLFTGVGDEGGFAPNLRSNQEALDLLAEAVSLSAFSLGKEVVFALDVAASELYEAGLYQLQSESKQLEAPALIDYYASLIEAYPIVSIEDGLDEKDSAGWQLLTERLGERVQLVGDDIFVTNPTILQQGIDLKIANAILIKPNQIGTLTETRQTMQIATSKGYRCIVSHRSGETEDTFLADLAVATGCGQIKTGSLCRTDRLAKYNQLLRIEAESGFSYAAQMPVGAWVRS